MLKYVLPILGIAALAALPACGGGSTTSSLLPIAQTTPGAAQRGTASATFTIRIPNRTAVSSSDRSPLYVSPGTSSIKIETLGGATPIAPTIAPLSSGSPGCSSSGSALTCSVSVAAAPGVQQFRLSVYASVDATGTALGMATVSSTINAGQANIVPVTLGGVVSTLAFTQTRVPVAADGATHVLALNVTAMDAAGDVIVAPGDFYSSIALAKGSDDPNNALTLGGTSITTPAANGSSGFTVTYDSTKALASGTITATAGNASASVAITPLHYSISNGTLLAGSSSATLSLTVSEAGTAGPFTATSLPLSAVSISGNGTASAASAGGAATLTLSGGTTGGQATITIGDGSVSGSLTVNVTATSAGIAVPSQPIITEFSGLSAAPNDIVSGPDGDLWFTETLGNKIGRMTTSGVLVGEYPVTYPPYRITTGPDGSGKTAVWFTEVGPAHASKIGRLSVPSDPAVVPTRTEVDIATANAHAVGIESGPDGNIWFAEEDANKIGKLVPATGVITEYVVVGSSPRDIVTGPDGALWFTEFKYLVNPNIRKIGRITTAGAISEMSIDPKNVPTAMQPASIALGADGNLWFSEYDPNSGNGPVDIGKMTPSGAVTLYTSGLTQGSSPDGLKLLRDGNIWFVESNSVNTAAKIARITPNGTIAEFGLNLTQTAGPAGLTSGSDGNVWFTEFNTFAVGRVRF